VGAGLHTTQTIGLALATDLAPVESHPKVVGLMYVMLLVGMISSALLFGTMLVDFTPARLVQVIQGCALATMVLNVVALWKQEARRPARAGSPPPPADASFSDSWRAFTRGSRAVRRLAAIGLGTMAFSMEDVLLEPYGGQILHLTVGSTTKLTATLAIGGLLGFGLASRILSRGADPFRMASAGALVGIPAFLGVILAAPMDSVMMFGLATFLIGFGGGLFGHGTLTATMVGAPAEQRGLALGAWGAVQATAAGIAVACSGVLRDVVGGLAAQGRFGASFMVPATGYSSVYALEIVLLVVTLIAMLPLTKHGNSVAPLNPDGPPPRDPLDTLVEFYANR
jgi:BCD family chlorophyll transporter-like MFS transporter